MPQLQNVQKIGRNDLILVPVAVAKNTTPVWLWLFLF